MESTALVGTVDVYKRQEQGLLFIIIVVTANVHHGLPLIEHLGGGKRIAQKQSAVLGLFFPGGHILCDGDAVVFRLGNIFRLLGFFGRGVGLLLQVLPMAGAEQNQK